MIINIRGDKVAYIHIGEKTFYIDDSTDEGICEVLNQ